MCDQSSACSSPRRSPAYKAVAHTARSAGDGRDQRDRLRRARHPLPPRPNRRQRQLRGRVQIDLAPVDRPPVDRPQRQDRIPNSTRRTPLPHQPINKVLHHDPRQAREPRLPELRQHPPPKLPLITPKRRRLIRRPRPRPHHPRLRRRQPLHRNLPHRHHARRPQRLPADRRLALLPPRPRLRQRPKRPPNRPPITPRPHLRLIRRRTPTPTPTPTRTPTLMTNRYPLMRTPPTPNTTRFQLLHHRQTQLALSAPPINPTGGTRGALANLVGGGSLLKLHEVRLILEPKATRLVTSRSCRPASSPEGEAGHRASPVGTQGRRRGRRRR